MLSNNSNSHTSLRLKAGRGAFYKLQGVGLCANGLKPQVVATVFNHVIQPILTYGMNCISINRHSRKMLNTTQCKLLKAALGLKNRCRNTRLLNVLNIHKVTDVIRLEELSLFRAAVTSSARTRVFYGNMWIVE